MLYRYQDSSQTETHCQDSLIQSSSQIEKINAKAVRLLFWRGGDSKLGLQAAGEATEQAQCISGHLVLTEAELAREPRTVEVLWEFLHWGNVIPKYCHWVANEFLRFVYRSMGEELQTGVTLKSTGIDDSSPVAM